jgi:hypothetical protein
MVIQEPLVGHLVDLHDLIVGIDSNMRVDAVVVPNTIGSRKPVNVQIASEVTDPVVKALTVAA